MGYYLLDHPNPYYPQTRPRTAWGWTKPTGLVTVHTAEGALDRIAPDYGAENVAHFISTRKDAGGYHVLVDSDSTIDMAPDDLMTWHTAAHKLNGPGWGVSAACRSTEWDLDSDWTHDIIRAMGAAVRAFWLRQGLDPNVSARWLTEHDVASTGGRIVGLIHHGVAQPADRTDAWVRHPHRHQLDELLLEAITNDGGGVTPPSLKPPKQEEDDDMLKAPRPSWVAPKGRYGINPNGRLVWVSGPAVADQLDSPNQGHPPELLAPLDVTDETLDGLLAFYNE